MGRIFKFDKDVDTDQIIASQYLLFSPYLIPDITGIINSHFNILPY